MIQSNEYWREWVWLGFFNIWAERESETSEREEREIAGEKMEGEEQG